MRRDYNTILEGLENTDRKPTYEIFEAAFEEGQDDEIRLGPSH